MSVTANQVQTLQVNPTRVSVQNTQNKNGGTVPNSAFLDILQSIFSGESVKTPNNGNPKDNFQSFSGNNGSIGNKINALKNSAVRKDISAATLPKTLNTANALKEEEIEISKTNNNQILTAIDEIVKIVIEDEVLENIADIQNIQVDISHLLQLLGVPIEAITQIIENFNTIIDGNNGNSLINFGQNQIINTNLYNFTASETLNIDNANNINTVDTVAFTDNSFVRLDEAVQILNGIADGNTADILEIPEANRQIISELAANLENIISNASTEAAIPTESNQVIIQTDFRTLIANAISESVSAVQTQTQDTVYQTDNSAEARITAFLEANNIDVQELKEAEVRASEENRGQNIREIVSSMRSMRINPAVLNVSASRENVQVLNNNVIRENIIPVQSFGDNSRADINAETEAQNQTLTQMAEQIRQFSTENVNEVVTERFNNDNRVNTVNTNNDSNVNTDEFSETLSGIINVRSGGEVNNTSQQRVIELRTHMTNAINEISNMVLRNRMGGNFELRMRLVPEALGEILVKVTYNRGNVNLNIVTDNKVAETQLITQVETLREALASHNYSLMGFDVGTKNEFAAGYNQQRENANNGRNLGNTVGQVENDSEDSDDRQNVQRLANLYMRRMMYKTI